MRVAILGATGQLGRALCASFSDWDVTALSSSECDVSDYESVMNTVYACGPDLILNAAAMTAVDECETEVDKAFAVNALGPRNLALAANALAADLVHVSTDYVFEGTAGRAYDEWDEPWPLSIYGRSKLGGEREVQTLCPRLYLVRTAVVFSTQPPNFALSILNAAQSGSRLQVVSDQVGSPTYAPHLAAAIRRLAVTGRYGLYHLAGSGVCSRADLARELLAQSGHDPGLVEDATTDLMAERYPAPRPANSSLECRAWRLMGRTPLPTWQEGVRAFLEDLGQYSPFRPEVPTVEAEGGGAVESAGERNPDEGRPQVRLAADLDVTDGPDAAGGDPPEVPTEQGVAPTTSERES